MSTQEKRVWCVTKSLNTKCSYIYETERERERERVMGIQRRRDCALCKLLFWSTLLVRVILSIRALCMTHFSLLASTWGDGNNSHSMLCWLRERGRHSWRNFPMFILKSSNAMRRRCWYVYPDRGLKCCTLSHNSRIQQIDHIWKIRNSHTHPKNVSPLTLTSLALIPTACLTNHS